MRKKIIVFFLALLCCACEGDYPYSRRYPCHFMLKYDLHQTSLAFAAVKSVGMYVSITTKGDGRTAVRHVYVTSNETGLIVGCTNFNGPVAYDRSCPNCGELQKLEFTGNRQQVACDGCKRSYMLDTGGIISGASGDPLQLYKCQFDGVWLTVTNGLKP